MDALAVVASFKLAGDRLVVSFLDASYNVIYQVVVRLKLVMNAFASTSQRIVSRLSATTKSPSGSSPLKSGLAAKGILTASTGNYSHLPDHPRQNLASELTEEELEEELLRRREKKERERQEYAKNLGKEKLQLLEGQLSMIKSQLALYGTTSDLQDLDSASTVTRSEPSPALHSRSEPQDLLSNAFLNLEREDPYANSVAAAYSSIGRKNLNSDYTDIYFDRVSNYYNDDFQQGKTTPYTVISPRSESPLPSRRP